MVNRAAATPEVAATAAMDSAPCKTDSVRAMDAVRAAADLLCSHNSGRPACQPSVENSDYHEYFDANPRQLARARDFQHNDEDREATREALHRGATA